MIKGLGVNIDTHRISGSLSKLEEELSFFQGIGFDYVEIPPAGLDVIMKGKLIPLRVQKVKDILSKFNFKYTVHAPDVVNLRRLTNPLHKKVFVASIKFAGIIGAEVVVYHCGKSTDVIDYSEKQQKKAEIKALKEAAVFAAENNLIIGVENLPEHHIDEVLEIVDAVNHPNVKMTLDVAHLYIASNYHGWDYLKAIEKAMPYVVELHVSDTFGSAQELFKDFPDFEGFRLMYGVGDLHLPIGYGEIPFSKISKIIAEKGFSGIVILEINNMVKYAEEYKDSYEKMRRYFLKQNFKKVIKNGEK
ncbi:MAG: sugar phosphate isomerase/epimerase [Thermotogaceae bacterium]|nr:sugar phosphate isomerase/epimerase [Thermotogaceae bacterium]